MTRLLSAMRREAQGWSGPIINLHADLGRSEWSESLPHAQRIADECDIPLVVVRRERGDLIDRIEERLVTFAGKGINPFPSAKQRFCTSELKRNPLTKYMRRFSLVVSAIGVRREESKRRGPQAGLPDRP